MTKDEPLISIIIPFFNAEQFLQEAIESVLAQTYYNWELNLVDDGSIDRSTENAKQYAKQYPKKVHYLEHGDHTNRGANAARNLGIRHASGKYIAFLDADDKWFPDKLEQQVEILESKPEAGMVYGPPRIWFSWTGMPQDIQRDYVPEFGLRSSTLIEPPQLVTLFLKKEADEIIPSSSGILVRHDVIEQIGGFEDTFRNTMDDQVFYAKLGLEFPVYVSDKCWYFYRQHPTQRSTVTKQTGQYLSVRLTFLNWLQEYLTKRGGMDKEVGKVLQQELWPYRNPRLANLLSQIQRLVRWIARRTLSASARKWLRSLLSKRAFTDVM